MNSKIKLFIFQISFFIVFDQITKIIFSSRDFFIWKIHFHLVKNYGLSFNLNFGTYINTAVILVALILFGTYLYKSELNFNFGLVLILSGAISNLADRVYLGYVRDFIDLQLGFTFNIADLFIFLGLYYLLFLTKTNKNKIVG